MKKIKQGETAKMDLKIKTDVGQPFDLTVFENVVVALSYDSYPQKILGKWSLLPLNGYHELEAIDLEQGEIRVNLNVSDTSGQPGAVYAEVLVQEDEAAFEDGVFIRKELVKAFIIIPSATKDIDTIKP